MFGRRDSGGDQEAVDIAVKHGLDVGALLAGAEVLDQSSRQVGPDVTAPSAG
jgi:hypothetical protein